MSPIGPWHRGQQGPSRRSRQRDKRTEVHSVGESLTCGLPERGPPLCGLCLGSSGRFNPWPPAGRGGPSWLGRAWKLHFRRKNCPKNADFVDFGQEKQSWVATSENLMTTVGFSPRRTSSDSDVLAPGRWEGVEAKKLRHRCRFRTPRTPQPEHTQLFTKVPAAAL
jgi:hypothetical protein